ncbi:host specificity protein, partial [Pseudomonas neuropathica]
VTDKVATDAAAAAANALTVANTKADASAVNSLTTRVEATEGTISSQGTSITGLTNSLTTTNTNVTAAQTAANAANTLAGGKGKVLVQAAAPAAADQLAQNLWIDITGGANTPKRWTGSAWAAVTDKVATDAAAAAANALTVANTKADASTVTALSNTVTQQGSTLTAQGAALTSVQTTLGGIGGSGSNLVDDTYSWLTSTTLPATGNYSLIAAGVSVEGSPSGFGYQLTYTGSVTNARSIFGTAATPMQLAAGKYIISFYASANVAAQVQAGISDVGASNVVNGTTVAVGAARARYSALVTVAADRSGFVIIYINRAGMPGVIVTIDSLMVERQLGDGVAPSSFVAGPSAVAVAANSSATSALDARVVQSEAGLVSQGSAITGLTNSLTITNTNVTAAQMAANTANTLAGGKGKVLVQTAAPSAADQLAQNLWIDITGGANTPKRWTGSAWAAVTDKVATDAAAAAANALTVANTKADASAFNNLTTRVDAAEGTISSQGTSITGLTNSLATTNTNVTAAQTAANTANTLAGGKGKVLVQTAAP